MNDNLPEDTRQNGGAVAWTAVALVVFLLGCALIVAVTGCAHDNGNTVPVSAVP